MTSALDIIVKSVLVVIAVIIGSRGDLVVYPHADILTPSTKFAVTLTQRGPTFPSFTYISTSNHRMKDASSVKPNRSVSWTSFAFTSTPVTVEIYAARSFSKCYVRPRRYNIPCHRITSNVARFDVPHNGLTMSVEFDTDQSSTTKDITDKLFIFVDEPETHVPLKTDPSVMFFDVGVHDLNGQLHLPPGIRQVYLAPGAFLQGGFITTASHPVNITGRGIMSGAIYPFHDNRFVWGLVNMDKGSNHLLEGVTLVDSPQFFYRGQSSFNTVRNVKMLAPWTYNSDGVGIGMDGLVEDSFIWANDDTFKVYQSNLVVRRCVVWQAQNGAVFQMGWWPDRRMRNATLSNIDVIHTDWCTFRGENCRISDNDAVLDLGGQTNDFETSDVEFRNIRIEDPCPRTIYYQMSDGAVGSVSNFRFLNWTMAPQPLDAALHNVISGSRESRITDWQFVNFTIGGNCITNPAINNFIIDNRTTSEIDFKCPSQKH
ncbi:dextranase-like [Liolophura sinensis]|uniref:dextranase-like n=1 Tax=Liolophura sinensis TaxID=3198878 RepID=UPI0031582A9E